MTLPDRIRDLVLASRKMGGGRKQIIRRVWGTEPEFPIWYTDIRQFLEEIGTTENWGQEDWSRADKESICETCKRVFRFHPQECGPGYGRCGDEVLFLVRTCNGKLWHL